MDNNSFRRLDLVRVVSTVWDYKWDQNSGNAYFIRRTSDLPIDEGNLAAERFICHLAVKMAITGNSLLNMVDETVKTPLKTSQDAYLFLIY